METTYTVAIYCRLSRDDETKTESSSISTQKAILRDYCKEKGYSVYDFYVDDGYSGLNFNRPAFQRLLNDIGKHCFNMVITKDLSRLGRDYIFTGYYSEIFFPLNGIRYLAISDGFDSDQQDNDIAPFKNILNDMYARDISKKIKCAKRQQQKEGRFLASSAPFGYQIKDYGLIVDIEAAAIVKKIYTLYLQGFGDVTIAKKLNFENCKAPQAFSRSSNNKSQQNICTQKASWNAGMVGHILKNRVYLGELINHKTEVLNCKTKKHIIVPPEERFVFVNNHEAIISDEIFNEVQILRSQKRCPAKNSRMNIFRGLLYCDCCGHKLSIAHKVLYYKEDDIYRCMQHFYNPSACPQTHIIYHTILYQYILKQIHGLAKSMRSKRIQSIVSEYVNITDLTSDILNSIISRIEIGHYSSKVALNKIIRIHWKI